MKDSGGSPEGLTPEMEQGDGDGDGAGRWSARGGPPAPTLTGVALVADFFKANPPSPMKDTIRKANEAVEELLAAKVPEDIIREALQKWRQEKFEYGVVIIKKLADDIRIKRAGVTKKPGPAKKVNYSDEEHKRGFRRPAGA